VDVNELNLKIQHLLPGDLMPYTSIDSVCDTTEAISGVTKVLYWSNCSFKIFGEWVVTLPQITEVAKYIVENGNIICTLHMKPTPHSTA
jgi:hypothetical protein